MGFKIDTTIHWAEHYVRHGFCVVKDAASREFCQAGLKEFARALGTDRPPREWSAQTVTCPQQRGRCTLSDPGLTAFLLTVYDQPGVRAAIDTMLGSADRWDGVRACNPFLCVYDAQNKQELPEWGHVDFLNVRIPIIGNGMGFQVALIDTEPFSGNVTIFPGYHGVLQKHLIQHPDFWYEGGDNADFMQRWRAVQPKVEPYEFVAQPGDMLFFHHLVGHEATVNAAAGRTPRVCIHGQVAAKDWPNVIDPATPNLSPWERSLALNGRVELPFDERVVQAEAYAERKRRPAAG